jgi:large repetitive protein
VWPALRPLAAADAAVTDAGGTVAIRVKATDKGITGVPAVLVAPRHGRATVRSDGGLDYAAAATYAGSDTFTYRVCSPNAAELCATAPVTVTVRAGELPVLSGSTLAATPGVPGPVLTWIVTAWCLIGGGVALVALARRRRIVTR